MVRVVKKPKVEYRIISNHIPYGCSSGNEYGHNNSCLEDQSTKCNSLHLISSSEYKNLITSILIV